MPSVFDVQVPEDSGGDFTPPVGAHPAVLVALIDLGTHNEEYAGQKSSKRKIFFVWELPTEKRQDGSSHTIGKAMTLSFNEKAKMRQLLTSWRGKQFSKGENYNLSALLGKQAVVTVTHKEVGEKSYAEFNAISPKIKNMADVKATYPLTSWEVGSQSPPPDHKWLPRIYGKTVKEMIAGCLELRSVEPEPDTANHSGGHVEEDSEIPF